MNETISLDFEGWRFLCSGKQLPSGGFQASVRYRAPPDGQIRTLLLNDETHATAGEALAHAQELAMNWVRERGGDGRGQD